MEYVLVLVTLLSIGNTTSPGSGVSSSTSYVPFKGQKACDAAAEKWNMKEQSVTGPNSASVFIMAKCHKTTN